VLSSGEVFGVIDFQQRQMSDVWVVRNGRDVPVPNVSLVMLRNFLVLRCFCCKLTVTKLTHWFNASSQYFI